MAENENENKPEGLSENLNENLNESKPKNVSQGGNIFDDSFFDTLNEIDDGLGNTTFQKLGSETHEDLQDIMSEKNLNLEKKEVNKEVKFTTKSLPVTKLPQTKVKETDEMNNKAKFDPLNLPTDDPAANQMKEIWDQMDMTDSSQFKLMVLRLEPATIKGTKISGYLETFHLPTTIPDIIEQIGQRYGGGRYQIRIVDASGKYVKSRSFEISGLPKIPGPSETPNQNETSNTNQTATNTTTTPTATATTNKSNNENDKDDELDDLDDWGDEDFDPTPRHRGRLRPLHSNYPNDDPYYPREYPSISRPSIFRKEENKETKEVEEKVTKLESKIDKISEAIQNVYNNKNAGKSLFDADVVKAIAPVFVTWLDSKGNKDNNNSSQFSEMNKQIVGLMQGMQDLVRISDKSKDDLAEKERKEREQSRREMLEYQNQMEQRFADQQRKAEERHQTMLLQMRETLESKHHLALEGEQKFRLDYEKLRQEFREKEEKARDDAKAREERLREEARQRDEDARRSELEFREKTRQEEVRWREELRQREEESRRREIEWKEELRQKELGAVNESKLRELDIMKQIREMDHQKTDMQQKLIEQIYNSNNNNRESQLQMELAVAKMTSDNESRMLQANAEMQLEKIRHATQMQMAKMKHDLNIIENKKSEDPIDSTMQDYLRRKLQIDMIKELNMDVDENDLPGGSFSTTLKKMAESLGPFLMQMLMGGGMNQNRPPVIPNSGRVVNPNINPVPPTNQTVADEDLDFEDETDVDTEEDSTVENESQEETPSGEQVSNPDLSGIDPMEEIPRVSDYFKYLKKAIEGGVVTPAEAASEAQARLSTPIVDFLSSISDSTIVIQQIYPILNSLGEEFANFFIQPAALQWMDKMLAILNKNKNKKPVEKVAETKEEVKEEVVKDKKPNVDTQQVEELNENKTEVKTDTTQPIEDKGELSEVSTGPFKGKKKRVKTNNVQ